MAVDEQFLEQQDSQQTGWVLVLPASGVLPSKSSNPTQSLRFYLYENPMWAQKTIRTMRAYQFIPCIFCFFVKSSDYRMRAIFVLIDLILYHVSHIPLGACVAIAKAGYPPSGFSLDSFHLSKRQTGLTHGPQFRNSFDPCVVHANESRISSFYMIHF